MAPVLQFATEQQQRGIANRTRPIIQSGRQFSSDARKSAAVAGRLMRCLDMTHDSSASVQGILVRTVAELMRADYEAGVVMKAIGRTEKNSWVQLAVLREAVFAPPEVWAAYAQQFDDYHLRMQEKKRR